MPTQEHDNVEVRIVEAKNLSQAAFGEYVGTLCSISFNSITEETACIKSPDGSPKWFSKFFKFYPIVDPQNEFVKIQIWDRTDITKEQQEDDVEEPKENEDDLEGTVQPEMLKEIEQEIQAKLLQHINMMEKTGQSEKLSPKELMERLQIYESSDAMKQIRMDAFKRFCAKDHRVYGRELVGQIIVKLADLQQNFDWDEWVPLQPEDPDIDDPVTGEVHVVIVYNTFSDIDEDLES